MTLRLSIFILLFLSLRISLAQNFLPQIDNYTYGDNQNWGIGVNEGGLVFAANNKGLVLYNGQQWELLELPKKTIVRSVFIEGERIYTGSYEEFGYWKRNSTGVYTYTSLTNLLDEQENIDSEEFWQITSLAGNIYFRSFGGVYSYTKNAIKKINFSEGVAAMTIFQDKLILENPSGGLVELKEGRLMPLPFAESLSSERITHLTSFENFLFVYTTNNRAYIYDGKRFSALDDSLNSVLARDVLNKAVFIDLDRIAFGTIKNGIVFYDLSSKQLMQLNRESGLNNNTVLGLCYSQGNAWVALDNGISKINLNSSYRYYFDISGDLGTVYDIMFYNEAYYLASNTGIYSLDTEGDLQLIQKSEGHVWNLDVIDDKLFAGHNEGTFIIDQNEARLLNRISGGVYKFIEVPGIENTYLQAAYSGINVMRLNNGEYTFKKINGIDIPINNIIFKSDSTIWATHPYKGLYKLDLNAKYDSIISFENYSKYSPLKESKTTMLTTPKGPLFYNDEKWYSSQHENGADQFKEIEKLSGKISIGTEKNGYWFIDRAEPEKLLFLNENFDEKLRLHDFELYKHLVVNYEKVVVKNDSIRLINLNDGFAKFNKNKVIKTSLTRPYIHKINTLNSAIDTSLDFFELSFKEAQDLTVKVYTPNAFENKHTYVLQGSSSQQETVTDGIINLYNLKYGDYSLDIFNSELEKNNTATRTIVFTVLPPWYYSTLAYLIYFLLTIALVFVLYEYTKRKRKLEHQQLVRQYTRETEKKLFELEKSNLEEQVNIKKKELTNSITSIVQKNEAIIHLRNELKRLKDVSNNPYRTKKVLAASEKYINNQSDWQNFENNFKEINADFFDNIVSAYPKITNRDLKLCAYIKTGLTSKEMAPLMGISVRGLELRRYRLRKKMGVDQNDNFQDFLRRF